MALGKGLSSLIPTKLNNPAPAAPTVQNSLTKDVPNNTALEVNIEKIVPNPEQPRQTFEPSALRELSDSIRDKGILQPLVVTKLDNGGYELIAGERRLQASKLAGLKTVPVIVKEAKTEVEKLELALIENIQRQDLNPLEKAFSFKKLQGEFNFTQEQIASRLGKNRASVANTLRLLELPEEIQQAIKEERITEGHARSLAAIKDPIKQKMLFDAIIQDKLSVRDTEQAVKKVKVNQYQRSSVLLDPELKDMQDHLIESLGTKVSLKKSGKKGKIIIEFYSEEELRNIIDRIS